jgi:hypothetical protein
MSDWQQIFQSHDRPQLGPDFEERVFLKIRKKKKLRKISYGLTAGGSLILLLSLLQIFRPTVSPVLQTKSETPALNKEEIPLQENLLFSASDNRTRYSLEPVSYQKKINNQNSTINRI